MIDVLLSVGAMSECQNKDLVKVIDLAFIT
jgi:hypothetical protein